jgi:hypothetical protein
MIGNPDPLHRFARDLAPTLLICALTLIGAAAAVTAYPQSQERSAEIVNSGSTNAAGYRIIVRESGHAKYIPGKTKRLSAQQETEIEADIPARMTKKFFEDIDLAAPLAQLPVGRCAKSVSFGTSTFVKVGDEQTPDVSCPGEDSRMKALFTDAQAIRDAVKSSDSR